MKKKDKKQFAQLEKFAPNSFKTLKEDKEKKGYYKATIQFSSYTELFCTISDLLILSITESNYGAEGASPHIKNTFNHQGILELILQLLPVEEAELLDEIRPSLEDNKLYKMKNDERSRNN